MLQKRTENDENNEQSAHFERIRDEPEHGIDCFCLHRRKQGQNFNVDEKQQESG
jgi:hypothetical protein